MAMTPVTLALSALALIVLACGGVTAWLVLRAPGRALVQRLPPRGMFAAVVIAVLPWLVVRFAVHGVHVSVHSLWVLAGYLLLALLVFAILVLLPFAVLLALVIWLVPRARAA